MELFTSQGCSSCPPAENWLNTQGMELFKRGKIIPLAFHVDYWDYLGWKDPFSSEAFTARQRRYAETLGIGSPYTPQMVVGGKAGFVGSDGDRASWEISASPNQPVPNGLVLKALVSAKGIQLKLKNFPSDTRRKVWAAVFENGLVTQVERGENRGETLEENFVVRRFLEVKDPSTLISFDTTPNYRNMGMVVFIQDSDSMEIKAVNQVFPLTQ
jgi:hypothetical protein